MSDVLQFQFSGVEQGVDPKALPPGALLVAENCAMDKARRLCKRAGTASLVKASLTGADITAGRRLISRGTDTALADSEYVHAYSPDLTKWQRIARQPNLRITRRGLVDTTRSAGFADVALYGDLLVTVFLSGFVSGTGSGLHIQVENVHTGAKVLQPLNIGNSAAWPRLLISGTDAIVVFSNSVGEILASKVSLITMTFTAQGSLVAVAGASNLSPCDFAITTPASGDPTMYVAWTLGSGVNRLAYGSFLVSTFAVVTAATNIATTSITPTTMSVAATPTEMHIAASLFSSSSVRLVTVDTATLATSVATFASGSAKYASVTVYDATRLLVCHVGSDAASSTPYKLTTSLYSIAAHTQDVTTIRKTWHAIAMTNPWTIGGRWYTLATVCPKDNSLTTNTPIPNASSVIVEIEVADSFSGVDDSPGPHMGTAENLTGWFPTTVGNLPQVAVADTAVYVPAAYRNREPLNFMSIPVGWNLYKLELGTEDVNRCTRLGASTLQAAGTPFWYDGASAMPYGFVHAPMILSVTAAGAGGSQVAGTYSYVAVYEWRDANGVLHRSIPSPPRSHASPVVAGQTTTVSVATTAISSKELPPFSLGANPVSIALYRTAVGGTGPHYRLTLEPSFQMLTNTALAGSASISDTKADADIGAGSPARPLTTQPQLYTELGELADIPPPSFVTVTTHRGRLVGIGPDLRTLWLSKDSTNDTTIAPGFNEALVLAFADDKTALASLDDKLVVFGENDIDVVFGDGPDDRGGDNTWQIAGVQTDVGCVNPRSPVTCPMGVVFESSRGLELFGRDLNVAWIGESVEDTLAAYPTITSAVLVPEEQEIRFTCTAADGETGIVLAWNYAFKVWFTRKYADLADTSAAAIPFVDAALIDGVYTMLTAGGQVYQETEAHKLDNGTGFVERDVVLAPISPAGNQSWHRVKQVSLLGTSVTNHDLKISVTRDYATSWEQTETFLAGSLATTIGPLEQCRVTLAKQKCQAVQVRIQDLTPTTPVSYPLGNGDGPIFEAVALRVGVKSGTPRTAPGQQR